MNTPRNNKLITAIGSALISAMIAVAMGQVYGLAPIIVLVMGIATALLAGYVGYRSSER